MGDFRDKLSGGMGSVAHRSLEAVRRHLGMDVAYLSEFVGEEAVFREVDAPGLEHLIQVGDTKRLEDVYCRHILAGRLPQLIPDTAAEPIAAAMPITAQVPIRAHVSVPIRHADGEVYGMFCCLSATPRATLNDRDLHIVHAFAELVAEEIQHDAVARQTRETLLARARSAFAPDALAIHLQPVCALADGRPLSYEALARFAIEPRRSPDRWFADAAAVGLGEELEMAAIVAALAWLPEVPAGCTLSINASSATVIGDRFARLLPAGPLDRIVLEVTEHAAVADYAELERALEPLRARGLKLAVDDAGAGFAGLQHILRLRPDIIKLDMALIRGIDRDPARRALARAMQDFAMQTGAILVGEGIETPQELNTLVLLGFARGQGYLLGRPEPAADLLRAGQLLRAAAM